MRLFLKSTLFFKWKIVEYFSQSFIDNTDEYIARVLKMGEGWKEKVKEDHTIIRKILVSPVESAVPF